MHILKLLMLAQQNVLATCVDLYVHFIELRSIKYICHMYFLFLSIPVQFGMDVQSKIV